MTKRFIYLTLLLALLAALVQTASAAEKSDMPYSFTTHTLKVGSIQIQIDPVDLITQTDVKQTLAYRLTNSSDAPIECSLAFAGCEALRLFVKQRAHLKSTQGQVPSLSSNPSLHLVHEPYSVEVHCLQEYSKHSIDSSQFIYIFFRKRKSKTKMKNKNFSI